MPAPRKPSAPARQGRLFPEAQPSRPQPAPPPPPPAEGEVAARGDDDPPHPRAFAAVAVNAPVRRLFDYRVPPALRDRIAPGWRVRVPFHGRRMVGYVVALSEISAAAKRVALKSIDGLVDEQAMVPADLLELATWMARRYFASVGECLEAMLPAGVRHDRRGRREKTVHLQRAAPEVEAEIERIEKRYPRRALLLRLLLQHRAQPDGEDLTATALLARASSSNSPLRTLQKEGWIEIRTRHAPTAGFATGAIAAEDSHVPEQLTFEQLAAERRLATAIAAANGESFLLHGVTGSGKTEVYLRAIARVKELGKGAIVLVPEIALTPQLVQRFASRFSRIAVLHSGLSDVERGRAWQRVRAGEVDVVIGPRSALFAPFAHLGLIVLDEEHEPSYKQESTPRYHARDVALERARRTGAVVVLGSATPSLETYCRALSHRSPLATPAVPGATRHVMLSLPSRVSGRPLPPVLIVDLRQENLEQHRRTIFSRTLVEKTNASLARGEQVILFLNRRGYSTYVHCTMCGWTQSCERCAINMTYHRQLQRAWCHYCGETALPRHECPDCGHPGVKFWGFGTERIAEELVSNFPDARVERMDSDTMTTRDSYDRAFQRLRRGEVDILMGTQMIAKGLDLPSVTLVGVLYADIALAFPDFRAAERTFQLIAQVAGRAGRSEKGGEVIVQCFRTEHYAIQSAQQHDFVGFAAKELPFRRSLGYPPYGHLARMLCECEDPALLKLATDQAAAFLRPLPEVAAGTLDVLGPAEAPIGKIKDRYRRHLLLKFPTSAALLDFADRHGDALLASAQPPRKRRKRGDPPAKEVRVILDVDPTGML